MRLAKIVRNTAATMSVCDFGTRASRFLAKWTRHRWGEAPWKDRVRAFTSPECWSLMTISGADPADRVRALKQGPGRDIVLWGGADIAQQFTRLDLIDEYQLMVQPIALGGGEALFAKLDDWKNLRLVACQPFDTGAVMMKYAPATDGADPFA